MKTNPRQKMRNLLKTRKTPDLVKDWEYFDKKGDKKSLEFGIVRGEMLDEFERRDKKKFNKWLNSKKDSPRGFY